mgnify:CR=1 FL=1
MENRIPVYQDDPDTYMENICSDKVSQNGSENSSVLSGIVSPLIKWYRENKRILPWRDQNNAYYTWVSEIMLQQTRVEVVKPYFIRFITELPDPAALASCPEKKLMKLWEGLGYYNRVRNMQAAACTVVEEYGGKLPESYEKLMSLKGIGSYTAGAIASIAYGIPVPAVDGNVLRVLSRVTGSFDDILKQSTKKKMEALVSEVIQPGSAGDFNQALIETGAMICIPGGAPLCSQCPFFTVCAARSQGLTEKLPVKTPKKKRKIEEKTVLLLEYQDKIAIRKRREDGLLASLYEFVNVPGQLSAEEAGALLDQEVWPEPLPEAKHIFSHVEWHMGGYFVSLKEMPESLPGEESGPALFLTWEEIRKEYPVPNAFAVYKKYLDQRYGGEEE